MKCLALVLSIIGLVGCGTERSHLSSETESSLSFQLVLNGGNATCRRDFSQARPKSTPVGMGGWPEFFEIVEELKSREGVALNYLASCYENASATIHYVSHENPDKPKSIELEDYFEFLNTSATQRPDTFRIFTGHSYGGWLVLKTAEQASYEIDTLISNDPISRVNCTFSNPAECTRSPTDISPESYSGIAEKSSHWNNYYETRTWYLHSSPIEQADENFRINTSHVRMDDHQQIWNDYGSRVRRLLEAHEHR